MLRFLPPPPPGTRRIIEPFLGSGAYSLSWIHARPDLRAVGLDADPRVIELWRFLQQADPKILRELGAWWEESKKSTPAPRVSDVRDIFGEGASLYFKINVCGVYAGQWSASQGYPQFSLPLKKTLEALEASKKFEVLNSDWKTVGDILEPDDAVFLDPPYMGTRGNYANEVSFNPSGIQEAVLSWGVPVLFTYGTGAPEIFPELPWELAQVRKVPNIRRGGTVTREEWVSRINWPQEQDIIGVFAET